jgi:hypothetical protein
MARQLGFLVIDMGVQFVGDVDEAGMNEVRNELHFQDLYRGTGPSLRVRDRFRDTLPHHCNDIASVWRKTALDPTLSAVILYLKVANSRDRGPLMEHFRAQVKAAGLRGGW